MSSKDQPSEMPGRNIPPDLSNLTGSQVGDVAAALTSGPTTAILERADELIGMNTDDIQKLSNLVGSARFNCGGFGCG